MLSDFLDSIHQAKIMKREWVETTPEIIAHYNRGGLNGAKYFIYEGIKVCEPGMSEEIEKEMEIPINKRLHGSNEPTIQS